MLIHTAGRYRRILATVATVCGAALLSATAHAMHVLPNYEDAIFTGQTPDNPFFPMTNSETRLFAGSFEEDGELITEAFELTNTQPGPTLLGVQTFTQVDRAFEDGLLVELTSDYYAQDTDGNVWYFGEDVLNYIYDDDGKLIETTTDSAWLAGVNDALPGFIMPVDLGVGFAYFQEFAETDDAVDQAQIWAVDQIVTLDIGTFTGVLQILETNPLDPDSREFKYYAPGVGLVLVEEGLDENLMNPTLRVELQASAVPEPGAMSLLLLALATTFARRRRTTV